MISFIYTAYLLLFRSSQIPFVCDGRQQEHITEAEIKYHTLAGFRYAANVARKVSLQSLQSAS